MNGHFDVVKELKGNTKNFRISELTYTYIHKTENDIERRSVTKYEVQFDELKDIEKELECNLSQICSIEMKV